MSFFSTTGIRHDNGDKVATTRETDIRYICQIPPNIRPVSSHHVSVTEYIFIDSP